ncbi:MAG TPA: hypothetical protein VJ485_00815 [archaeon]|nr:hypothetical protein [archaeon]
MNQKKIIHNKEIFNRMYRALSKGHTNERLDYEVGKDYKEAKFRKINGEEITIRYEKK